MGIQDTLGRGQQIAQQAQQAVQTARDVAQRLGEVIGTEGPRLEIVHFAFRVLNGPDPSWHVRRVKYSEGLSQPYEIVVDVLTAETGTATDELLGADVEFEMERGELLRSAYGVIHRVDYIGITGDNLLVRCHVVPAFRLASQRVDTRIFQDMTVLEVVEEVLGAALEVYGRTYDPASNKIADPDVYPKRDYCVQYGESDFDFVSRLLEEEGIAYYFEPDTDAKKEKLVLIDNNNDYPEVTVLMDAPVPIIVERPEMHDRESLRYFEWCQPSQINKVVVWQHNWKVAGDQAWPVTPLDATSEVESPPRGHVRELYIQGDRRKIVDKADDDAFAGEFDEDLEVAPQATKRLDLLNRQAKRGQGRSNVTGFTAGYKFELANHTRDDLEAKKYLLTRVIHTGDAPEEDTLEPGSTEERYANSFECIPDELPFRPALVTRRPRIYGPQTAIVTGPGNEEIHTDKYGRIKLKFHWDRLSPVDETSSAWVRVAQTWAGPGWGAMFIPRIGMEVVVEFLDGNPDRPLVTGCVYNAFTSTPFPLPNDKTKSTIKTQSSPNKQGFNELTFEDLAGSEQIIIHAQKDFNEKVEHNHTTLVGANQTNSVDGNQSESVGGNQTMSVSGNRTKTVTKNEDNKVDGSRTLNIKGDETMEIKGHTKQTYVTGLEQKVTSNYKLEISDLYDVKVTGAQKVQIIGTSELKVTDTHTAVATNGYAVAQAEAASMVLKGSKGSLWGEVEAAMAAGKGGEAVVKAEASGKLGLSATSELKLVCGTASITLTSDGKIAITGSAKVEINGGTGGIKLDATGAAISGPSIKSAADGIHEITGAMVKIN